MGEERLPNKFGVGDLVVVSISVSGCAASMICFHSGSSYMASKSGWY
jgi:hypothetical protein